ncbi:MAG TPA: efflux RND transporter periplasmic adaptor subunit [Sphingomonas sp.]|nr:efflux RND transporter periplasmic adaptor subunit [Sphingomonas sp.]
MNYDTPAWGKDDHLALTDETGRSRRGLIIGVIVAVLLALIVAWFVFSKKPVQAKPVQQIPNVSVAAPGRETVARVISATGSLAAQIDMPVGVAGEGGRVTQVLVQPGQWVGAGQVLATVDRSVQSQTAASLAAQVSVAQADAKLAQANVDRAQALVGKGFISRADLDTKIATRDAANARVRVAQATLAQQRASNGRLDIRAPAAGLVLMRSVEPGQIVSAGSGMLFRMAKDGKLEMRALLSEADMATLKIGDSADVTPVGGTERFAGHIWQVSPVIDPQTRQGVAKIALAYNPALRPGGFASASIRSGTSDAPQLPNSAIQSDEKGNFVYIVGTGDKVERRAITIGEVSDSGVSITSGLTGSERVVLSAGAFLNPGQKVKPLLQKTRG